MNEFILILVPIVIIILSVCRKNKNYRTLINLFYYSKYIALFIPFILIYLRPDLKKKILSTFKAIDNQPIYKNMNNMMHSYMETKHSNPPQQHQQQYSQPQTGQMPMNNRMNMINRKNIIPNNNTNHKRSVSESKKKYIASNQKWKCSHCNQILDNTYEVDHIIPLYKGGSNELNNLEALCRNCHGKKTFKDKLGI